MSDSNKGDCSALSDTKLEDGESCNCPDDNQHSGYVCSYDISGDCHDSGGTNYKMGGCKDGVAGVTCENACLYDWNKGGSSGLRCSQCPTSPPTSTPSVNTGQCDSELTLNGNQSCWCPTGTSAYMCGPDDDGNANCRGVSNVSIMGGCADGVNKVRCLGGAQCLSNWSADGATGLRCDETCMASASPTPSPGGAPPNSGTPPSSGASFSSSTAIIAASVIVGAVLIALMMSASTRNKGNKESDSDLTRLMKLEE